MTRQSDNNPTARWVQNRRANARRPIEAWEVGPLEAMGRELRRRRVAARLSRAALAGLAKMSPGFIEDIERGAKRATPESIERLARQVRVDPQVLLDLVGDAVGRRKLPTQRKRYGAKTWHRPSDGRLRGRNKDFLDAPKPEEPKPPPEPVPGSRNPKPWRDDDDPFDPLESFEP